MKKKEKNHYTTAAAVPKKLTGWLFLKSVWPTMGDVPRTVSYRSVCDRNLAEKSQSNLKVHVAPKLLEA